MATIDRQALERWITPARLTSYVAVTGDLRDAVALYDWNTELSGAWHETLGRFEVVLRNSLDDQLSRHAARKGWPGPWYQQPNLLEQRYHASLWVPALRHAFPQHPSSPAAGFGGDVRDRVRRLHFLRNRVAHHEPIFGRDSERDLQAVLDVTSWISSDCARWIRSTNRVATVLAGRPL
jgi:hypothetical protein